MQSAVLHFESSAFAISPGEEERTNPGIFREALANWVADQLRVRAFLKFPLVAGGYIAVLRAGSPGPRTLTVIL